MPYFDFSFFWVHALLSQIMSLTRYILSFDSFESAYYIYKPADYMVAKIVGKGGGMLGEKVTDGSRYMYHHVQALYEHMQGHV